VSSLATGYRESSTLPSRCAQGIDIQKGKSSGYRIIYQVKTPKKALLVEIYSKLDQGDISPNQIRKIIGEEA